jgi:hypothetical protein
MRCSSSERGREQRKTTYEEDWENSPDDGPELFLLGRRQFILSSWTRQEVEEVHLRYSSHPHRAQVPPK